MEKNRAINYTFLDFYRIEGIPLKNLCQTNKCIHFFSEIPIWLRVYFKASPTLDHHLKWELFRLPELECFEGMLSRCFKEELLDMVER